MIFYDISSTILDVDSTNRQVYYNGKKVQIPSQVTFTVIASDKGIPKQESKLKIHLNLLNSTNGVYFKTNFYEFNVKKNEKLIEQLVIKLG